MRQVSIYLNDKEDRALNRILKKLNIARHHAIKLAIRRFIEEFEKNDFHHRMPDGKMVECPEK
jgi:predicted transcriptional regulator